MIRQAKLVFFLIIMVQLACTQLSGQTSYKESLLPIPQQSSFTGKLFSLDKGWTIDKTELDANTPAIQSLQEEMFARFGLALTTGSQRAANTISLSIKPGTIQIGNTPDTSRTALSRQAYRIALTENKITIEANAPQGLFYGVQSLLQLIKQEHQQIFAPAGTITDWPAMNLRIIYWDDAHHLEKLDVLKREIRQASFYKINGFALKLEGHFQYRSAAPIVEPHALTAAQYQELTDYAAAHYVQLIPYLDAPAHVSFLLKHPEYQHLRSFPQSNYELTATNPETYTLLSAMFKELIDANKGTDYVMLSTDEAYYIGKATAEIDSAKALGGNSALLAQFISRMADTLKKFGRQAIFWCEYPLTIGDLKKLPAGLIDGEYDSAWAPELKERGIRQLVYTSTQGEEPLFPDYYPLPLDSTIHAERSNVSARVPDIMKTVAQAVSQNKAAIGGVIVAGWADAGLHPQTFWLGYATGEAVAWNQSGATADELSRRFFATYYRTDNADIKRIYELASRQAQFYEDSWDWRDSDLRKPIFGNHLEAYAKPRPAQDQWLLPLPVPDATNLSIPYNWADSNARRLQLAQSFLRESETLKDLLNRTKAVPANGYSLEVINTIARLCRQNITMMLNLKKINGLLLAAAAEANPVRAVALVDHSLALIAEVKTERNKMLQFLIAVWYKDWLPLIPEANGRKYLQAVDDVKDHRPIRTADMSYLIYRELNYPLDEWVNGTLTARNKFARAHGLKTLSFKLDWKKY